MKDAKPEFLESFGDSDIVEVVSQAQSCFERALSRLYGDLKASETQSPEALIRDIAITENRGSLIDRLEEYFETKYRMVRTEEGALYCWNPDTRIYEECEEKIRREIREIADTYKVRDRITRYVVNEVLSYLKDKNYRSYRELEGSKYIIAAANGWAFDVKEWVETGILKVFRPTPEYFIRHRINAEFHREKFEKAFEMLNSGKVNDWLELGPILCPRIHQAFSQWVKPEDVRVLYEIIGYTLYPRYSIHKMIMLYGEGGNGKSTYAALIRRFLGSENIASRSLQDLAEYRFSRLHLVGKLANIYPDIPKKPLKDTGELKGLTGEDTLSIDIKHSNRELKYNNYAKMIFTANELPPVSDKTLAWWRRWILIEFPNKFLSEDELESIPEEKRREYIERKRREFLDAIATRDELAGLLVMSLLALRELMKKGAFSVKGDFKKQWLKRVSDVYDFLDTLLSEGIEKDGKLYKAKRKVSGRVPKDTLYDLYAYFVREYRDSTPKDKANFTKDIEKYGITRSGKAKKYYVGIELKTENHNDEEESSWW
jgi:putative DNA primase/helicase